ncbi:hypothetical protein L227DRAFT_297816 [Lentinus tigrinus ALCF2SS1-6]|uniref:Secreted protein n=1 Tax=Lentinus tigrinus ALCF2SS1-6 TaxID=1328759 RepID=A0A5C2RW77_9APHY|nr:hypothetical protein L227DRAFT_297816 [Lentinus tigrinus ALCF2SS1-6]
MTTRSCQWHVVLTCLCTHAIVQHTPGLHVARSSRRSTLQSMLRGTNEQLCSLAYARSSVPTPLLCP